MSHQVEWENRQRNLKRYLVQILNQSVQMIELWLPNVDTNATQDFSDSDSGEEMDWRPEHEVIIPQPYEVRYIWDLGETRFENPPLEHMGCYEYPDVGLGQKGLGLGSGLRGAADMGSWCPGVAGAGRALEIRSNEEGTLGSP